jgi:DNA-nicking Smr family endonuclease
MTVEEKPRRRRLSKDEHALWRGVTRSIAPLRRRQLLAEAVEAAIAERKPKPKQVPPKRPHGLPSRPAPQMRPSPPLVPLDRRLKQRLARGAEEIAARIDLHGRTQAQAHAALLRFLHRAQADGARIALVITGKGSAQDDLGGERGVLRRLVPLWLRLPEMRDYVVGVDEAHVGHGGRGALYVWIRHHRGRT